MKQAASIILITLLSVSAVNSQTPPNRGATRRQTIKKGKVLRKTAKTKNAYHVNNGTRGNTLPQHPLTDNAPRTQPMVTKPLIPPQ